MYGAYEFLEAITVVLMTAAVTTIVCQRLKQPVVLGYILAGLIIGPHLPVPLVADPQIVRTLSELGVILLMFSLGLEFSLRKLFRLGPSAGVTAVVQCSLMVWLGLVTGRLLGWTTIESLFTGAIIAISSTTIIAKAFDEQGVRGRLRELVVGILIVEDLIAILLMAILTAVATGAGLSAEALATTVGRLGGFLVALVVVGLLVVPRAIRAVVRLGRDETTIVASIGLCFGVAVLAHTFGYSVALGAFIAGSLVSESGEGERIEHLIHPVRDVFGAIFFVSVGMVIDPALIARHWVAIAVLTVVVIVGKIVSVTIGAFATGNGTRTSMAAGMSLAQIGEFSFIIAGLGLSLSVTREFIYPVAVAVSAITTLTTPWLIRASGPLASLVDRKLPHRLQTFASLYGSWLERLRAAPREPSRGRTLRRIARSLALDTAVIVALVIGAAVESPRVAAWLEGRFAVDADMAGWLIGGATFLAALPFCLGVLRRARRLGVVVADSAFPAIPEAGLDRAHAPRRALVVTVQLATVLLAGVAIVAVTEPFLPGWRGALFLLVVLAALSVAFWRRTADLHGHVRAGAQLIIEVLAAQSKDPHAAPHALAPVHEVLPGIGEPVTVRLGPDDAAVGRTLAELDLRGMTGATVLAITRAGSSVSVPTAAERLQDGDVLALAGTSEAIAAARAVLGPRAEARPAPPG